MKQRFTILLMLITAFMSFAQQGISYKALIRDANGNVVANNNAITMQFIIYEGSGEINNVYQETHTTSSDNNGLIAVNIGTGSSSDDFTAINWGSDDHFLNVQIDIGSGLEPMGTTQFLAVPYAKQAENALEAANVTGLEAIDHGNGNGWRLTGTESNNYGNIGDKAVDLSWSTEEASSNGATGLNSIAIGKNVLASAPNAIALGRDATATEADATSIGHSVHSSGYNSTAIGSSSYAIGTHSIVMGLNSVASGNYSIGMGLFARAMGDQSVAIGDGAEAVSFAEMAVGNHNTTYTPANTNGPGEENWNPSDRLFVIGNGQFQNESDALIVYKNANAEFHGEIQRPSTGNANMVPIAYGSIGASGSILGGTGNFTVNYNSGDTSYTIFVDNTPITAANSSGIVTVNTSTFRTANTTYDGINMLVHIFLANGDKVQSPFQFVIYKL